MAEKTLSLPPTRAANYSGAHRGRPVSRSVPHRTAEWTTTLESELEHHAALIPRAFVEPVPRGQGLKRYQTRDLLASHARRVEAAERRGKTDPESAILAGSVVKWQMTHRALASAAGSRRTSTSAAATAARPNTAAGFVHYVPETPAEDRMNARWATYRQEEVVLARNSAAMDNAMASWAARKRGLDAEITRRIENRRRPLTATNATGMTFAGGITGAIEPPVMTGLSATMAAVQRAHLDSDSDGSVAGDEAERKAESSLGGTWRNGGSTRPTTTGSTRRRTDFAPQAVRPVTAASIASMGSVGTSDTSAALTRQRLRVPVVVPRGSTPAPHSPLRSEGMGSTWGGGRPSTGGGSTLPPLAVSTAGGDILAAFKSPDGGVGASQRFPARAIATPVFHASRNPVFRGGTDPFSGRVASPKLPGAKKPKKKRSPRSARGDTGPPPTYKERVATQSWAAGALSTRPRTAADASLTPLELAQAEAARREVEVGGGNPQGEVDAALHVFQERGFAVSREAVERAIVMTPAAVKRVEPAFNLLQLRDADTQRRAGGADGAGASRGASRGGSRSSARPGTSASRPGTAGKEGGKKKSKKPKKPAFVPSGMHSMDVSGGGLWGGPPSVAAGALFLPENPLEDLARALAAGKKKKKGKKKKGGKKKKR